MPTYIEIILLEYIFSLIYTREFLLCAHGWVGQTQYSFSWRRISRSEIRNSAAAKARAGKNSFPPTPFLFARPSDWISEFSVGIFAEKSSDFVQKAPPIFRIRILGDYCLALASLGLGRNYDFIRIFEVAKQFLPAQTEVRFAEGKHKFEKFINQSFFFRQRRKAKR